MEVATMKKQYSVILSLLIVAALVLAFSAAALATDTRTTTLDCTAFTSDQENEEEGWAWDASTRTLSLSNVDIHVDNGPALILPADSTIEIDYYYNATNHLLSENDSALIADGDLTINGYAGDDCIYGAGVIMEVQGDLTLLDTYLYLQSSTDATCDLGLQVEGSLTMDDYAYLVIYDSQTGMEVNGDVDITDDAYLYIDDSQTGMQINNGDLTIEDEADLECVYAPGGTGILVNNGKMYVDNAYLYVGGSWEAGGMVTHSEGGGAVAMRNGGQEVVVLNDNDGSVAIQVMGNDSNLIRLVNCGAIHPWFGRVTVDSCAISGNRYAASFTLANETLTYRNGRLSGAADIVEIAPYYENNDDGLLGIIIDQNNSRLPFTDVVKGSVEYEAVRYVYQNGLMQGVSADTFDLDTYVNRAMSVTVLHRLEGTPAADGSAFKDIPDGAWYKAAAYWGQANNIVKGASASSFAGTTLVTKEQLAAFFYRYAEYKGYDVSQRASMIGYFDYDSISEYAQAPMSWAVALGMFQMDRVGYIEPQDYVSRGELAQALRIFDETY